MAEVGFFRYELRTTDVIGAHAFYADVLGSEFWESEVSVAPLPQHAAARGAPAHWLGFVGTDDVQQTRDRMIALGGQQLGPTNHAADGSNYAGLRDAFGAVLGVSSETVALRTTPVAWHLHHSQDYKRCFGLYAALFGWTATDVRELAPQMGFHQIFAWGESKQAVGSMTNIASPDIHPHWLFFFSVPDIAHSIARVSSLGGTALRPTQISSGAIVVPCDDPQGAAFGLYQAVY